MKFLNFIFGLVILVMGLAPYLVNTAIGAKLGALTDPASMLYRAVLIVIGLLLILISFSGRKAAR